MTEAIIFFACFVIAWVFCRVLSKLPEDVARGLGIDGVDSGEPPNLRDCDSCYFCQHSHDTDWGEGMHCKKFDEWISFHEICDGFEHHK